MKKKFSIEEAAFIFGKTHATIYNWISKGKLPEEISAQSIADVIEEEEAQLARTKARFRTVETESALVAGG